MATLMLTRDTAPSEIINDVSRRDLLRFGAAAGAGIVFAAPVLSACSLGSEEPAAGPGGGPPKRPTGVLRIAANGEPVNFDPMIGISPADLGITAHNVYESLVRYKHGTSDLEGVLAESFESSPDAREWSFKLKEGITFHDGEPFTSSAARATYEYAKSEPTVFGLFLPEKATYDDSDPQVLRITVEDPFPDMARFLSVVAIMSPKLVHAGIDKIGKTPIGTGPFVFKKYSVAESVIMEANPDYRGPGPYLERLEFPIIPDADARVAALRSGGVDIVTRLAPQNAASLQDESAVVVSENKSWASGRLIMIASEPPMDNVKVRQAIAHAIDREAIVKSLLRGIGGTVVDSWVASGLYGSHAPAGNPYAYDPELARKLIAESGLPTPVKLTIVASPEEGAQFVQIAQAIAGMLTAIGIEATAKSMSSAERSRGGSAPAGTREWQASATGIRFITGSAAHPITLGHLKQIFQIETPELTKLQTQILTTPNGEERLQLFADLEDRVAELAIEVPLYDETTLNAHKKSVKGYVAPQNGLLNNYGQVYLDQ